METDSLIEEYQRHITKSSYRAMLTRCTDSKHPQYKYYGGKGVKVFLPWLESFDKFVEDMGLRPSKQYSIERINSDKDYEPNNCRWATKIEQANNKSCSQWKTYSFNNEGKYTRKEFEDYTSIPELKVIFDEFKKEYPLANIENSIYLVYLDDNLVIYKILVGNDKYNLSEGMKFGRLTLLNPTRVHKNSHVMWKCKCNCGNETEVFPHSLVTGNTSSCGCLIREITSKRSLIHGKAGTKISRIWSYMKTKCYDKNKPTYQSFGAKGITVCEAWKDFQNFYSDMGDLPYPKAKLKLKEGETEFNKDNCYWL